MAETGSLVLWVSSQCVWRGFVSMHVPVVDCALDCAYGQEEN